MVPTASPFADLTIEAGHADDNATEEDFYLHLHLPPELDLPLPATTQIYHQPPSSYLIPRWDLGRNSGVFTRIEFPSAGSRNGLQEDVDTFETILAQCTAFLERAPPPTISSRKDGPSKTLKATAATAAAEKCATTSRQERPRPSGSQSPSSDLPAYNPATYKPGEAYAVGSHSSQPGGQLVLVDEEDGSVIGELESNVRLLEDKDLLPGSKGKSHS